METIPDISKSKYLAGLQCHKLLWVHYHDKGRLPETDAATQVIFDQGQEVGRLAQSLFPGGVEVPWDGDFGAALARTRELLAARRPLYEATFSSGGAFARADILNPVEGGHWDVIEVKSSTKVKDVHIPDLALQRYCYEGAGVPIRRCHLMHINNQYVRRGVVDAAGLLKAEDVTDSVAADLEAVGRNVEKMRRVISGKQCPDVAIGPHCDHPYPCPLKEQCWAEEWKAEAEDEPVGELECDCGAVRKFLGTLVYPLYLLDFETIATAIPLFEHARPYRQVPVQFSLHVVDRLVREPRHFSWLWEARAKGDPRREMLEILRRHIGADGSILAYNKGFEERCLEESAEAFPEHAAWVDGLMPRMIDLAWPFRKRQVRHPAQRGSWSLKAVLPALTGKGYDELAIAEGGTASAEIMRISYTEVAEDERARVRRDLELYCGQDTRGMLDILRELDKMAGATASKGAQ